MIDYSIKPNIVVAQLSMESISRFNIGKEVLVIVSKTVYNTFNLEALFNELDANSNLHIFKHIKPDAPFKDLDFVIKSVKNKQLDSIIAIGGGSVIDAAKTLSVSFEGIDYKDIFYKRASNPNKKIKVLAIPTTAGTGAELSYGSIIYDNYNGVKGGLRGEIIQPDNVLIDANLHNACPFKLKAEVGFDCLTHAVETYISKKSNSLVRLQSVECIKTILKYLNPACKNNNFYAMEKVALSSALMGINLAYSSTCLPHRIQYVIGPLTHTSHAQGLIALYKGWLYHLKSIELMELTLLAKELSMSNEEFLFQIQSLKEELNIDYSISDLGVTEDQINYISEGVIGNVEADPSYIDIESIKNILINSF